MGLTRVEWVAAGVELTEESEGNVVGGLEGIVGLRVGLEEFSWVWLGEDWEESMDFSKNGAKKSSLRIWWIVWEDKVSNASVVGAAGGVEYENWFSRNSHRGKKKIDVSEDQINTTAFCLEDIPKEYIFYNETEIYLMCASVHNINNQKYVSGKYRMV